MPDDVLTPVWSGQGRVASALELPLCDAGRAPAATQRCGGLSLGVRAGTRPHGERPQLRAVHYRMAGRRPRAESRGRLHPVQPRRGPADQPDRRPAQLGRLLLSAAERIQLGTTVRSAANLEEAPSVRALRAGTPSPLWGEDLARSRILTTP